MEGKREKQEAGDGEGEPKGSNMREKSLQNIGSMAIERQLLGSQGFLFFGIIEKTMHFQ